MTGMGDGDSVRRYVVLLYLKSVALTQIVIGAVLCAHRSLVHILKVTQSMNTAQVSCPGCKRVFNPRGLSQHLSKTRRAQCRVAHAALQTPSIFQAVRNINSLRTSAAVSPPHDPHEGNPGDDTGIFHL